MKTLTDCLRSAQVAERDAAAIRALRDSFKGDGLSAEEAGRKAVLSYAQDLLAERTELAGQILATEKAQQLGLEIPAHSIEAALARAEKPADMLTAMDESVAMFADNYQLNKPANRANWERGFEQGYKDKLDGKRANRSDTTSQAYPYEFGYESGQAAVSALKLNQETEGAIDEQRERPGQSESDALVPGDRGVGDGPAEPGQSAGADSGMEGAGSGDAQQVAEAGTAAPVGDDLPGVGGRGVRSADQVGVESGGRDGGGESGAPDAGRTGGRDGGQGRGDGAGSAGPADTRGTEPDLNHLPKPVNFHIDDPLAIVGGGQVARFEKNRRAITLYHDLEAEGRVATADERAILASYTGWGSFGQELFQGSWEHPKPKPGWEERSAWLMDSLGEQEWKSAQRSITNAHYTDPPTVLAMWSMLERMGFSGGRVLEPSMGIGNFFGMMPSAIERRSQLTGIELDELTGGMAKLIYPAANISIKGYQDSKTPDDFYDLVVGNWPFEDTVIADRRYQRLSPYLHDYFFLKALDQVRPGGLVVGITSKGTLDKLSPLIRREMAKKAELIDAFRLPTGAFEEYAGTKVVTDIIILRKRESFPANPQDAWIETVEVDTPSGEKVRINKHYQMNPDRVIGTIDFGHGTTFRRPGLIVHRPDDMMAQLARIVQLVPEGAYQERQAAKHVRYITNHTDDRQGSLIEKDGVFH
ncbi:MAG: hypothetical protein HQL47_03635, partial [Gammaproteobacteria bacterium]|nr:hypothetical protein [Gammaproteobacteria bacterium]